MAAPCGSTKPGIGHDDCNFIFHVKEHEGHKASPGSWQNSKNKAYKKKMKAQQGS